MTVNNWSLIYDRFEPDEEGLREALCTLGNGYFATRGAGQEAVADEIHYPGTYLAGGYNRLETYIAGQTVENEDLVNFPNWLFLSFRVQDSDWLNLMRIEILRYRVELDLRQGLLLRSLRFRDGHGRETTLESRRFVHMKSRHYAGIKTTVTAENWSGSAQIRSALDGRVINAGVARYQQLSCTHLEPVDQGGGGGAPIWLLTRTSQSRVEMAQAARTAVYCNAEALSCERSLMTGPGHVAEDLTFHLEEGQPISVEKIVALYTSRDAAISEAGVEARQAAERAPRYDELERTHKDAWERLWQRADITVQNTHPERATLLLHLHAFHLLQTISCNSVDLDAGVSARGLHGEAYRGHVFWDELFVFPFFNYRFPPVARALLNYRYRRLNAARRLAAEAGFRGAMFPWQSGSNGREESQRVHLNPKSGRWIPDSTYLQRHINAAVAYNVWQYYQATSDVGFLENTGAEMLLEIAHFWASVAMWNPDRDRYEIHGVMGPDEYHNAYPEANDPGINNNAYTNIMAVWCLSTALECLERISEGRRDELCEELGLGKQEIELWERIGRKMFVPFHGEGLISQFEGYEDLIEFDWEAYRAKYDDIQRLDRILEAEGDSPNRYKLSKQADVLMLFYLLSAEQLTALLQQLGYEFDPDSIPDNIEYYLSRTSHGSSLSRVVHSWVLARSDREKSWQLFLEALEGDVAEVQRGTTAEGIHLGAMAATIDLVERCYSGIELREGRLWLNPRLPEDVKELSFTVFYHDNWLDIHMAEEAVRVTAHRYTSRKSPLCIRDVPCELAPGGEMELPLE